MRWTSSTDLTSFKLIIDSIKSLNNDWYQSKKSFFLLEPCYDAKKDKIIIKGDLAMNCYEDEETNESHESLYYPDLIEYSLSQYCWISKFDGCLASKNIETINDCDIEIYDLPLDGYEICNNLLNYYKHFFSGITETFIIAQEIIDNLKVIKKAFAILDDNSYFDNIKYNIFLKSKKSILAVYGSHVTLFNNNINRSLGLSLSIEMCTAIADFKFKNKSLITSFTGTESKGMALFKILCNDVTDPSTIRIHLEDWEKQLFFYLLHLIDSKFYRINFSALAKSKSIFLKGGTLFHHGNYAKFVSSKLQNYTIAKKEIIEIQVSAL